MNETTKTLASQATAELPKSTACLWVTDNPKHCSLLRPAPNVVNAFPWPADSKTAEDAAYWRERGFWQEPLYTADQMNAHYLDGVEAGRAAAFAAVPPIDAVPGEPVVLDELRATICGVGIVGQINGDDVIRRESVIDLIDRRRLAASVASRAPCQHRIADARNAHVQSGYVCLDCGALFQAADHGVDAASLVASEDKRQAFERERNEKRNGMLLLCDLWNAVPAARSMIESRTGPWFAWGGIRAEWDWRTDEQLAAKGSAGEAQS